jgi:hypothetical protein
MIRLVLQDDSMPRTVFWDRFLEALGRSDAHLRAKDYFVPAEDIASETNWPAYGNPGAAFTRGSEGEFTSLAHVSGYLARIAAVAQDNAAARVLVVNMHPFLSVARFLRNIENIYIADGNLVDSERALNPRTISMPALPIATGAAPALESRDILASFQGVASHPIRHALASIADGKKIIVNLVDGGNYAGKVNALMKTRDGQYEELLGNSVFAFVPRGDANFSYRLLEVMSFGCIPVILSDGWVLPFDRLLQWNTFSMRFSSDAIPMIPRILGSLGDKEISSRFKEVQRIYEAHFKDLDCIVGTLFDELDTL